MVRCPAQSIRDLSHQPHSARKKYRKLLDNEACKFEGRLQTELFNADQILKLGTVVFDTLPESGAAEQANRQD